MQNVADLNLVEIPDFGTRRKCHGRAIFAPQCDQPRFVVDRFNHCLHRRRLAGEHRRFGIALLLAREYRAT